jgi:predicted DsbA family dithiol-disulfide isomerase
MNRSPSADRVSPADGTLLREMPIRILLVTSEGCHFCRHAEEILDGLRRRFPLEVERIDLAGPRGTEIARRWRVPFPPVLLIEGRYHAHGRLSERKLTRALSRLVEERG